MHTRNFEGPKEDNKAWGREQRKKQEFSTKFKRYNLIVSKIYRPIQPNVSVDNVQESLKYAQEILNSKSRSNLHIDPYQPI